MAVHFLEGHDVGKGVTEEDHTRDPEEENVPSGFEDRVGVEMLHVGCLLFTLVIIFS